MQEQTGTVANRMYMKQVADWDALDEQIAALGKEYLTLAESGSGNATHEWEQAYATQRYRATTLKMRGFLTSMLIETNPQKMAEYHKSFQSYGAHAQDLGTNLVNATTDPGRKAKLQAMDNLVDKLLEEDKAITDGTVRATNSLGRAELAKNATPKARAIVEMVHNFTTGAQKAVVELQKSDDKTAQTATLTMIIVSVILLAAGQI
jgi:hypothetical protein